MKIKLWFTCALACATLVCTAQNGVLDASFEFQAYPTGLIPGIRIEGGFAERHAAHLRLGYTWIRHGDAGKHDDERGKGFGLTLGYRYFFKPEGFRGFFLGARNDFWFNEIDWKNDVGQAGETSGTTEIIVVQPTVEAGWLFVFNEKWVLAPTLAFGYEVNVKTEGEPTGEGMIMLAGLSLGRRF